MKIGQAGEAFFIFETEDDIPDDLITSPLLEPTQTADSATDITAGRFGAKQHKPEGEDGEIQDSVPEPDFLDLDAAPKHQPPQAFTSEPSHSLPSPPPSPTLSLSGVTPLSLLARTGLKVDTQWKVNEYLQSGQREVHPPEVLYKHGKQCILSLQIS